MPSGYIHKSGPVEMNDVPSTASTGIARADALKTTSGKVLPLTTNAKSTGVADGVKESGDSATTDISVIEPLSGRVRFLAYEKRSSGSLAVTDRHARVQMSGTTGAMGFDSSATTNGDIYLDKNLVAGAINVGSAFIVFSDPAWIDGTN